MNGLEIINFELWVFPVKLSGDIQSVVLKNDGKEIYNRSEKLESLTLLLPQNEGGKPYGISVNGKPFQSFDAGLKPVVVGNPKEERIEVNLRVPGTNISIANLENPKNGFTTKNGRRMSPRKPIPKNAPNFPRRPLCKTPVSRAIWASKCRVRRSESTPSRSRTA